MQSLLRSNIYLEPSACTVSFEWIHYSVLAFLSKDLVGLLAHSYKLRWDFRKIYEHEGAIPVKACNGIIFCRTRELERKFSANYYSHGHNPLS